MIETLNVKSLKIESSSCQCSMTSKRTKRGNSERCISNSEQVKNYAERFSRGHWTCLGPVDEKKWYGTPSYTPEGKWDSIASQIVQRFKETSQPVLKSISALSRGILKKKELHGYHTLQCGCFEHSTLISHDSVSKSAHFRRSSLKLM